MSLTPRAVSIVLGLVLAVGAALAVTPLVLAITPEPDSPHARHADCRVLVELESHRLHRLEPGVFYAPRVAGGPDVRELRRIRPRTLWEKLGLTLLIWRAHADRTRSATPIDCSLEFDAAGYALDPGEAARTTLARQSEVGSDIVWFSRPVQLPGWLTFQRGEIPCVRSRLRLSRGPPPHTVDTGPPYLVVTGNPHQTPVFAERRSGSWRRGPGPPEIALLVRKPVATCPGPEPPPPAA